jgi:hypothetical protein
MSKNLPTIKELYDETELTVFEKQNALNVLLNHAPKPEWVKQHPMLSKVKYIPIERVEWLLTKLFFEWRVEIKAIQLIGNSVVVTVRLHYLNVVTGEWTYSDGVGASPLQTDKDAGAIEFDKLKSAAVMMAAPAAESYAVKDAAEKIGKIFGKDLNRADQIAYDFMSAFDSKERENLDAMKKVIDALAKYEGKDKEVIRKQCVDAQKAGTFTTEFAQGIAKKIGITL